MLDAAQTSITKPDYFDSFVRLAENAVEAVESLNQLHEQAKDDLQRLALNNGTLRGQLATAEWERDKANRTIEELRTAISKKGLKVVDGDFVLRSGRRTKFILRVSDPRRLLALGVAALEEPIEP